MMRIINRVSLAFYYAMFVHLILVLVGSSVQQSYIAPLCSESMPPCVRIAGSDESVWSIAASSGAVASSLILSNPTLPLFWTLAPGTRVHIPMDRRLYDRF